MTEVICLFLLAFCSYLIAEAASLSGMLIQRYLIQKGILSLFVCGIVMGRFTWFNLSEYSRTTTPQIFKVAAQAAETYVFLYLGLALFSFINIHHWSFAFIITSIVST